MRNIFFCAVAAGMFLLPHLVCAAENDEGWGTLLLRDTQGAKNDQKWKADKGLYEPRGNLDVKMQRIIMPLGYVLPATNVAVKISNNTGSFPDRGYYLDAAGTTVNNLWATYNPSIFNNDTNKTKGHLTKAVYEGVTVNFHHTEISTDGGNSWRKVLTTKSKGETDADIYCCHATYTPANFKVPGENAEDYGWTFFDEDNTKILLSSNVEGNVVLVSNFRVRLVYDYPVPSALWITDHADAGEGSVYLAVRPTLIPTTSAKTLTPAIVRGLAPAFKAIFATSDAELGSVPKTDWQAVALRDPTGTLDVDDKGLIWFKVSVPSYDENQRACSIVFAPPY